jgi:hypothetical protein
MRKCHNTAGVELVPCQFTTVMNKKDGVHTFLFHYTQILPRQKNSYRAARLSLFKTRSEWVPPGEAVVRISLSTMCPTVSGEKFALTENAGYSSWGFSRVSHNSFARFKKITVIWAFVSEHGRLHL